MSLKQRLLLIVVVEVLYMAGTRVAIHYLSAESFPSELTRTALRAATALVYWQLMKPIILSKTPVFDTVRIVPLIAGLLLFFSIPVLVGNYALNTSLALLFAVTSIAVAIKEEFLFRGILQNLLQTRFGAPRAVLYTSIIFTAWHIGTWGPSVWTFGHIFLASLVLGMIYIRTGSVAAVIALHALYDAVFSFTPLIYKPLNQNWGFVPLMLAVAAVYYWAKAGKLKSGARRA
jgi:membrane protease YdiL (CAAX protease family)